MTDRIRPPSERIRQLFATIDNLVIAAITEAVAEERAKADMRVLEEREACASLAETFGALGTELDRGNLMGRNIAAAVRARSWGDGETER